MLDGPDLDRGDVSFALGVLPEVLDVDPSLALGGAAAGGEQADNPIRLLGADLERLAQPGPLEPSRHAPADHRLAFARLQVAALDDL